MDRFLLFNCVTIYWEKGCLEEGNVFKTGSKARFGGMNYEMINYFSLNDKLLHYIEIGFWGGVG